MNAGESGRNELIGGDRRTSRRYTLSLDLNYKVTRGKRVLEVGAGRTEDMSSGGVAFSAGRSLPVNSAVELLVDWPMPLNGHPLRLVVTGRIVRSDRHIAALRIAKHEFRLAGSRRPGGGPLWSFGGPTAGTNNGMMEAKPARPAFSGYDRK